MNIIINFLNSNIGIISSYITTFLFLVFLLRKFFASKKNIKESKEVILINPPKEILKRFLFLYEVNITDKENGNIEILKKYPLEIDFNEGIIVSSNEFLKKVTLAEIAKDKNGVINFKKGTIIKSISNLRSDEAILFKIGVPCGMPQYMIECERRDYTIANFIIQEDGRFGLKIEDHVTYKNTILSSLYNFFK